MENKQNSIITYLIYKNTSALSRALIDKNFRNEYYSEVNKYKLNEIDLKESKVINLRNKLLSSNNLPSLYHILKTLVKSDYNNEILIITEESIKLTLQVVCLVSNIFCVYTTKLIMFDYKYSKKSRNLRYSFRYSVVFAIITNTFNIFMTSFYKNKHFHSIQEEYEMINRKYKKLLDSKL